MREVLDLFSAAAGGWSLGMHRAGYRTIAACEVVPWRRAVYAENNPDVRLYDDVRTLTAGRLLADLGRLPSIVVGSPPCQDISSANTKGRGVEGERSGLYFEAIRIIGEVRPRWAALENSANLRTRGADAVLAALEELGYACWPFVVRAGDVGANHERPRCWLLACDVEQVADADRQLSNVGAVQSGTEGEGRGLSSHGATAGDFGWPSGTRTISGGYGRLGKTAHATGVRCGARPGDDEGSRREADGHEPADGTTPGGDPDHGRIGPGHVCKHGIRWPHPCQACDDAAYANSDTVRLAVIPGRPEQEAAIAGDTAQVRNPANPDQARWHSRRETGWAEELGASEGAPTDRAPGGRGEGCSAEAGDGGQMGLCPPDRGDADRSGPDWSLAHLADHLRLDDGLSAQLAGTRVDVGDGKGQSAASLVVEAFGDAVIPQIPEAIGRAIIRVEEALSAVHLEKAA